MNHDTRHDDRPAVVVTAAGQVAVGAGATQVAAGTTARGPSLGLANGGDFGGCFCVFNQKGRFFSRGFAVALAVALRIQPASPIRIAAEVTSPLINFLRSYLIR